MYRQLGAPQKENKSGGPWAHAQCAHWLRRPWTATKRFSLSYFAYGTRLPVPVQTTLWNAVCDVTTVSTRLSRLAVSLELELIGAITHTMTIDATRQEMLQRRHESA